MNERSVAETAAQEIADSLALNSQRLVPQLQLLQPDPH